MRRPTCRVTLAIATSVALAACGSSTSTSAPRAAPTNIAPSIATTTLPSRNGPFAIGTRNLVFVDTTRKTPAHGNMPERPSRTLETIIEYPARATPGSPNEITGASPASGTFPVVVFVHGFSAHADNPYLHGWAASGYVAVAITFPLTNADTPGGPSYVDTFNEPGDVRFVLDQLAHLPRRDARLQQIIDTSHSAVVGQSLGAQIAFDLGFNPHYHDRRIAAVVAMSGGCVACLEALGEKSGPYFTEPPIPVMFIHGTADPYVPINQTARTYAKTPAPKFFLQLIGAKHLQYGPPWEPIAGQATIDFFDHYLKNDSAALAKLAQQTEPSGLIKLEEALY